ncbi:MAG: acyl-CoA thioesterase [Bdellovibrionales bacterium]|nr:acyl-CoA thioesterase [Bdellovibrionales bacterium]
MQSAPLREHIEPIRVRYSETDQMAVAYHGQYLVWFDLARTGYMEAAGYKYKKLEEDGILFMVRDMYVRYRKPARFDDRLAVRTRVTAMRQARLKFCYSIERTPEEGGEPELLATAWTVLACVDRSGKPRPIPEHVKSRFEVLPLREDEGRI